MPTRRNGTPGAPGEPYPEAPACPDHDKFAFHGLWDAERGCHYDHSHGQDPRALDDLFGELPHYVGGVSGVHMTPNENDMKHEGYKWFVGTRSECGFDRAPDVSRRDSCVLAWRVMIHNLGGARDAIVRFHSIWGQFKVCDDQDLSDCGTVTAGHWADFGVLVIPYKGQYVPLAGDPQAPSGVYDVNSPGYRGHSPPQGCPNSAGGCPYTWLSDNGAWIDGTTIIQKFGVRSFDDVPIDPSNPSADLIHAGDHNHSNFQMFAIWVNVPWNLDDDRDGYVTYEGFTDRYGRIVTACGSAGVDCVPVRFVNAPVGLAQFADRVAATGEGQIEHDIFFTGVSSGWIGSSN